MRAMLTLLSTASGGPNTADHVGKHKIQYMACSRSNILNFRFCRYSGPTATERTNFTGGSRERYVYRNLGAGAQPSTDTIR